MDAGHSSSHIDKRTSALQIRTLRRREVDRLAQGHPAGRYGFDFPESLPEDANFIAMLGPNKRVGVSSRLANHHPQRLALAEEVSQEPYIILWLGNKMAKRSGPQRQPRFYSAVTSEPFKMPLYSPTHCWIRTNANMRNTVQDTVVWNIHAGDEDGRRAPSPLQHVRKTLAPRSDPPLTLRA